METIILYTTKISLGLMAMFFTAASYSLSQEGNSKASAFGFWIGFLLMLLAIN